MFREGIPSVTPAILGFGVLLSQVYRFGRLHFEVLMSKAQHSYIFQDGVRVLFLLQTKAVRVRVT
jgi:hypothetical protein